MFKKEKKKKKKPGIFNDRHNTCGNFRLKVDVDRAKFSPNVTDCSFYTEGPIVACHYLPLVLGPCIGSHIYQLVSLYSFFSI